MNINASLFIQWIPFAVLVFFTMRFIWPPIAKALDERAEKIRTGLAAADQAKAELATANKKVDEQLAATRNETTKLLSDAEKRAAAIVDEAKKRAEEEGAKIVAAAKAEAEQVLPIPISPTINRLPAMFLTTFIPLSNAAKHSTSVIAASVSASRLPCRIL